MFLIKEKTKLMNWEEKDKWIKQNLVQNVAVLVVKVKVGYFFELISVTISWFLTYEMINYLVNFAMYILDRLWLL